MLTLLRALKRMQRPVSRACGSVEQHQHTHRTRTAHGTPSKIITHSTPGTRTQPLWQTPPHLQFANMAPLVNAPRSRIKEAIMVHSAAVCESLRCKIHHRQLPWDWHDVVTWAEMDQIFIPFGWRPFE